MKQVFVVTKDRNCTYTLTMWRVFVTNVEWKLSIEDYEYLTVFLP